jgi:hypothetical protein
MERPLNYKLIFKLMYDIVLACLARPALMLLAPFIISLQEESSEEKYLKMTPTGLNSE